MCLYVRILSCVLFLNSASWANSSGQSASLFSLDTIREQSLQGVVLDGHFSVARFQQIKGDRAVDLFQQQYLPVFEDIWGSAQYSDIGLKVHRSIYGGYPGTSTEVLVADKAGEFVDFKAPDISPMQCFDGTCYGSTMSCPQVDRLLQLEDSGYYYAELMEGGLIGAASKTAHFDQALEPYEHSIKSPEPATVAIWAVMAAVAILALRRTRSKQRSQLLLR